MKKNQSSIATLSPLYNYWKSQQDDEDEKLRIRKANNDFAAVKLFTEEPYKWEILFQSSLLELVKGNDYYLKSLNILIRTLREEERAKLIRLISQKDLLSSSQINMLSSNHLNISPEKKNNLKSLTILFSIFFNPYNLEIKRQKKHLYEFTGYIFFMLRTLLNKT